MHPQNESKEVRVLRKYIDENANLNLTVKQLQVDLQDALQEAEDLRRSNQELQAQLNDGDASQMEA